MTQRSWHTCRQKQQLAKARAAELGTTAEGEKLHSDSGVFLDTHSLQEPHQMGKGERHQGYPSWGWWAVPSSLWLWWDGVKEHRVSGGI